MWKLFDLLGGDPEDDEDDGLMFRAKNPNVGLPTLRISPALKSVRRKLTRVSIIRYERKQRKG